MNKLEREKYFNYDKLLKRFPNEEACEAHLFSIKYPNGFQCARCGNSRHYSLHSRKAKRRHLLECSACSKQESLKTGTIFEFSKVPLKKWFTAIFYISQTKKGLSALLLSKYINVAHSTALMMLHKIRRSMEEDGVAYQIGGEGKIVEADEIEIGGKNASKQDVLVLLEKKQAKNKEKLERIRFILLPDKTMRSIELALIPFVAKGTTIRTDGKSVYATLAQRYSHRIKLDQIAHWEENHQHEHLKSLNMIVGNLKKWYKGMFNSFHIKNTAYYLNEFSYRFNRRRSEVNIFDRLLNRCIQRPHVLPFSLYKRESQYSPLAA